MLKVLIISYNYPPLNNGGVERPLKMVKFLPKYGLQVSVVTQTYSYKQIGLQNNNTFRIYDINRQGLNKVIFYPARIAFEGLTRLGYYCSRYMIWLKNAKRQAEDFIGKFRPHLILATYPPHEALELALYLSETYKLPLITDFRDGLMFESIEGKHLKRPQVKQYLATLERKVVDQSKAIITVSDPISDYFRQTYGCKAVFTIPNGYDADDFNNSNSSVALDPSHFNIVYTGRLSKSDEGCDASTFFKVLEHLCKENPNLQKTLRLYFIGDFTSAELSQMDALRQLGVLQILASVSRSEALAYQQQADLLLLVTSLQRKSVATGKLFEYLYASKPILALTHKTFAATIVQDTHTGWIMHPHDEQKIYDTVLRAVTDKSFYNSVSPKKEQIDRFSRQKQVAELAEIIKNVYGDTLSYEKAMVL